MPHAKRAACTRRPPESNARRALSCRRACALTPMSSSRPPARDGSAPAFIHTPGGGVPMFCVRTGRDVPVKTSRPWVEHFWAGGSPSACRASTCLGEDVPISAAEAGLGRFVRPTRPMTSRVDGSPGMEIVAPRLTGLPPRRGATQRSRRSGPRCSSAPSGCSPHARRKLPKQRPPTLPASGRLPCALKCPLAPMSVPRTTTGRGVSVVHDPVLTDHTYSPTRRVFGGDPRAVRNARVGAPRRSGSRWRRSSTGTHRASACSRRPFPSPCRCRHPMRSRRRRCRRLPSRCRAR
jgi:hypothetical protein